MSKSASEEIYTSSEQNLMWAKRYKVGARNRGWEISNVKSKISKIMVKLTGRARR